MRIILVIAILIIVTTIAAQAAQTDIEGNNSDLKKDKTQTPKTISGDFFAGVNQTSGNTDKGSTSISGKLNKNFENSLWENKGELLHSRSNSKMDQQKWYGSSNYSFDFKTNNKWFSSYKITVDHDRFANIDYRLLPSAGIGYWFSRQDNYIFKTNTTLGYEFIKFREDDPTSEDEAAVIISDTYFKKQILKNSFISEELNIIPSLKFSAGYRIKSISIFSNRINKDFDMEIKYIIDYNSEPSIDSSTTDKQFILGIKYKF